MNLDRNTVAVVIEKRIGIWRLADEIAQSIQRLERDIREEPVHEPGWQCACRIDELLPSESQPAVAEWLQQLSTPRLANPHHVSFRQSFGHRPHLDADGPFAVVQYPGMEHGIPCLCWERQTCRLVKVALCSAY